MALLTTEQRILAPVLGGTQTVWTGRPLRGFRLRKGDAGQLAPLLFLVPFFAFWESMALHVPKESFFGIAFPLFGLGVFCMAVWQTSGQVLYGLLTRGRTYYALTIDGSAVIVVDGFGGGTKRIYLPSLSTIDLESRSDGSGSITFGGVDSPPWWMRNRYAVPRPPSFDSIANVVDVYNLCTKLQQGKSA